MLKGDTVNENSNNEDSSLLFFKDNISETTTTGQKDAIISLWFEAS